MRWFVDFVFKARLPIIIGTILITAFFGYQLKNITVNSDVVSYLPKNDPAVTLYHYIDSSYGGNALALIALKADSSVFSPAFLHQLNILTEQLRLLQGISSVTSITDVIDIKEAADGTIEISKLVDPASLPATLEESARLQAYTLGKKMYKGRIVSEDGKSTLVVCQIKAGVKAMDIVTSLKQCLAKSDIQAKAYLGGVPVMIYEITNSIFSDLKRLIPLVTILIIITLFISFGTVRGVVIPLLSVGIACIWTVGTMSMLHVSLTIISDIIPVLLIAIGTAPCIHILGKFDEDVENRYGNRGEEAKKAYREVGLRVILAAVTIIFGFTSFIFGSYLTMIREFGIFSSLGVLFSLLISTMFIPSLLTFIHVKRKEGAQKPGEKDTFVSHSMNALGGFVLKNELPIVLASIGILILAIVGFPHIQRKVDMVDYFKVKSPIRITEGILEKDFGGSRPIHILIKGDMQNPFVLKEIRRLEKFLESQNIIKNSLSAAGLISQMNDIISIGRIIPDARGKVSNLYFLLEGQDMLSRMVNQDKTEGVVTAMTGLLDIKRIHTIVDGVEHYIASIDTALIPVNLSDISEAQRTKVYAYTVDKIITNILWDSRTAMPGIAIDTGKIRAVLLKMPALTGLDIDSVIPARADSAIKLVSLLLPQSCQGDTSLINNIRDDILELTQNTVAVPVSFYRSLGINGSEPEPVTFSISHTGMPLIYRHLDKSLVDSQFQSFLIALVFIFILLAFQLRSPFGGLLGLIPILLTVVLMFGIMGFTGIPIDVATVLVASIALGIGIDYSIHFSVRFKTYYKGKGTEKEALDNTLKTTGKAIIINVLAVTMGFITVLFAELVPMQRFGILVAITMIGSGLGALTLLPATILLTKAKFVGRTFIVHMDRKSK